MVKRFGLEGENVSRFPLGLLMVKEYGLIVGDRRAADY
jgi:hypothetical protein